MTDEPEPGAETVEANDDKIVEADDEGAASMDVPPDYLDPKPLDPTGR
jgi:hypothetical protein